MTLIARMTAAEFERWADLPENRDRLFELINGEIVVVTSNDYSSELAILIGHYLLAFVLPRNLGRVTGADGGYMFGEDRYIPDCAYISYARQAAPSFKGYNPTPPDLAVEVLSPANTSDEITTKVVNYLRAGTVVWVVDPQAQRATVYAPDAAPKLHTLTDTIDGGDVLPGFTLPVQQIFRSTDAPPANPSA